MRRRVFHRFISWFMVFIFALSIMSSVNLTRSNAQEVQTGRISVNYNKDTRKHEISFPVDGEPEQVTVGWHDDTGAPQSEDDFPYSYANGNIMLEFSEQTFKKDHIYDLQVNVKVRGSAEPVTAKFFYLFGITFKGESFNVMTDGTNNIDMGRLIEGQSIVSGRNPRIKLTWNVPTIYVDREGVKALTELVDEVILGGVFGADIDEVRFHIDMNVGRGSNNSYSRAMVYNDDWSCFSGNTQETLNEPIIYNTTKHEVSVILDRSNGIEPGTEYENTRIRFDFKKRGVGEPIALDRIGLKTASASFSVKNEDIDTTGIDFSNPSSIYTPIEFRIKKVDEDMIMVEFDEIRNGNYPELFYQIQYDTNPNLIYHDIHKWPRIKWIDPYADKVAEIVPFGPGDYIAVVFFANKDSNRPLGASLNLRSSFLDEISIDAPPPLPKNIEASVGDTRKKNVTVVDVGGAEYGTELLLSDLNISFDAPLAWKQLRDDGKWEAFQQAPYGGYEDTSVDKEDIEYTFHVLLSSYRPDAAIEDGERREIGQENIQIYMPVKQKRVLVIGKKNLTWDPRNPDRLIVDMDSGSDGNQFIPGDRLFWDYTLDSDIYFENDADLNEDGRDGDYPDFLVPNTIYYMQIFTSRYKDNGDIRWAEGVSDDLRIRLSYLSPVVSFTTLPLDKKAVPVPSIKDIEEKLDIDEENETIDLAGIWVKMDRVLTKTDWQRYTSMLEDRILEYVIHISQSPSFEDEYITRESFNYDAPGFAETDPVPVFIDSQDAGLKPNTTYYFKVMVNLYAPYEDSEDKPADPNPNGKLVAWSDFSPIKAFTTPKIAPKDIDDITRKPSAPTDFAIAKDENGEERITDARADLTWRHRENDVIYELICTVNGDTENFADDEYNKWLIESYESIASGGVIVIDPENPRLEAYGFSIDDNNQIIMPIGEGFLRPNNIYFFSLRTVRKDGKGEPSDWVTLPVTTRMVKAPEYFEVVRDLQVGFNVECDTRGTDADSMEVYMKKRGQPDSAYTKLLRSQYTVVKDGTTYYFRVYNLEPDTLYHFRLYNKAGEEWYDYDEDGGYWGDSRGEPIPVKTRDTFSEIEVRWVGEELYDYFLELRSEHETVYKELTELVHYGYELPDGSQMVFYREKTNAFVREGAVNKYVYYALISRRPVQDERGLESHRPLETNTLYYVRLWAKNKAEDKYGESLRVGPVSVRTDFSQDDYDKDRKKDDLEDVYNMEADQLLQKLYWLVDSRSTSKVRALVKGDMVSGLLQASPGMTVTIDFSGELPNAESYEILVPQRVLETIESNDSRLNLKLSGTELTINRGSIDISDLKLQGQGGGAKEAMLCLRVQRVSKSSEPLPQGTKLVSRVYDLSIHAVGSKYTYAELGTIIYDILVNPEASGPFNYGIFDREMARVLGQLERYSYRSHTELKDMIKEIMKSIETELSWYLKDILDGGSGRSAGIVVNKSIHAFPGRVGLRIEYQPEAGLILPYVNYNSKGWGEVSGAKGYVMQYVLFRADAPGEYAVLARSSVSVSPGSSHEGVIGALGSKYDLTKVFGNTTIYPGDPMTGQQAVMLYAVITGRENELTGLTPNQKVIALGIGDVLGVKELTGYMENQSSVSLAVMLYCEKSGIPLSMLQPSKTIVISNAAQISTRLYRYVVLGIDLGLAPLKNYEFDATGRSTIGQVLDMISKVLEEVGEI
ncbi:MAG: hypothetical protein GX384_08315 [Clostridiaceae bacterium]|nr:hypothetical protein [Clostridiaceae bacterium]